MTGLDRHQVERPSVLGWRCHPRGSIENSLQLALQRPVMTPRQTFQRIQSCGINRPDVY